MIRRKNRLTVGCHRFKPFPYLCLFLLRPCQKRLRSGKCFFLFFLFCNLRFCLFLLRSQPFFFFRFRLQFLSPFQKFLFFLFHLPQQFQAFLPCADLYFQFFADRGLPVCLFALLPFLRLFRDQLLQFFFFLGFFLLPLPALFYLSKQPVLLFHLRSQCTALLFQPGKALLIHLDAERQQLHAAHHLSVKFFFFQLCKFFLKHRILWADNPRKILADAPFFLIIRFPPRFRRIPQPVLQFLINFRMEHFSENFAPVCRPREEKFLKIALRNHGNLPELTLIQSKKLRYRLGHFRTFCDRLPLVRENQLCIRLLCCHPLAAVFRAQILRIPFYGVIFSAVCEGEFYKGAYFRFRIFAAEHLPFPDFTARLAVECKRDRIKNCRFSRAGISCDQI